MSTTRKNRVPMSEQLKLINQCRKAASDQIQEPSYGHLETPCPKQEVVPVEIVPESQPEPVTTSAFTQHNQSPGDW